MNDRLLRVTVILSVFALAGVAFAGSAAAFSGDDVDVTVTPDTTNDPANYTITGVIDSTDASSVDEISVDFTSTAADDPTNLGGLGTGDVTVLDDGSSVTTSSVTNPGAGEVNITVSDNTFTAGSDVTIEFDNKVIENSDFPAPKTAEVLLNDTAGGTGLQATGTGDYDIQPSLVITGFDAPRVAPSNVDIDVSVTVENRGTTDADANVELLADDLESDVLAGSASETPAAPPFQSITAGGSATFNFQANTSTDYFSGTANYGNNVDFFHGPVVFDANTGTQENETATEFLIGSGDQSGAVDVIVEDTGGNPVDDSRVEIYVGSEAPSNLIAVEDDTSDPGSAPTSSADNFVRFDENFGQGIPPSGLAIGTSADPVTYVINASNQGFEADTRTADLGGESVERELVPKLTPIVSPDEINVIQDKDTALADGEERISFDVTVFGSDPTQSPGAQIDTDAEVLLDVDASVDNSSVDVDIEGTDAGTGADFEGGGDVGPIATGNGKLNLSIASDDPQDVDITFTTLRNTQSVKISGPGRVIQGDAVDTPRTKVFTVLSGEGLVPGQVFDESTTEGLPNASVYAVTSQRYRSNTIAVTTDLDAGNFISPPGNDTAFFRVRKDTDGDGFAFNDTIIDHDRYEVEVGPDLFVNSDGEVETFDFDFIGGGKVPRSISTQSHSGSIATLASNVSVSTPPLPAPVRSSNLAAFLATFGEQFDEDFNDLVAPWEREEQVGKVNTLDLNDSLAGQGFFAVDRNDDDDVSFMVTPLEPGNYTIERSVRQANASRMASPGAAGDLPFNFLTGPGDLHSPPFSGGDDIEADEDPSIELISNLTSDRARADSDPDGPRLIDDTDEDGDYLLSKLFTDGQAGVYYTLIAEKTGFDRDFGDVFVQEDGFRFEDESDEVLVLTPEEVQPEVNVTNLAILPNATAANSIARNTDPTDPGAYSQFYFNNQTDRFSQTVPRDGDTIDVLQVDTTAEDGGAPVNETIELSVPDVGANPGTVPNAVNFTGEFIQVAGGTTVSQDPVNATITINTGQDGQAIVWLQSDLSDDTLASVDAADVNGEQVCDVVRGPGGIVIAEFFSGVVAQSPTDRGVVDSTCKDFSSTVVLQTAELSGIVTNQNNEPVESRVWTRDIDLATSPPVSIADPDFEFVNHRIEVVRTGSNSYTVEHLVDNVTTSLNPPAGRLQNTRTLGIETGVTFNELSQDGGTAGYQFTPSNFPRIATVGLAASGVSLATDSDPVNNPATEDSSYTLPQVPAEDPDAPLTGITAKGLEKANFTFTGQSVRTGVQIGRTSTANIEITTPTAIAGQSEVASVSAPATVSQGNTLNVDTTVENLGAATITATANYELVNESGTVVETQTQTITLGGLENDTLTFSVDTTGLPPENYTSTVTTVDDATGESDVTEVVTSGGGGGQLFTQPLPAFPNGAPPTNTSDLSPTLFEDVDGDGDGLETSEAVNLWSDLVTDPGDYNGLTQAQVDALDWNGDGQLTPADAVQLWSEKVQNQP
jgi:hypothetical protein